MYIFAAEQSWPVISLEYSCYSSLVALTLARAYHLLAPILTIQWKPSNIFLRELSIKMLWQYDTRTFHSVTTQPARTSKTHSSHQTAPPKPHKLFHTRCPSLQQDLQAALGWGRIDKIDLLQATFKEKGFQTISLIDPCVIRQTDHSTHCGLKVKPLFHSSIKASCTGKTIIGTNSHNDHVTTRKCLSYLESRWNRFRELWQPCCTIQLCRNHFIEDAEHARGPKTDTAAQRCSDIPI